MACEVSIIVKNEEKRQSHKHVIYEKFSCNVEDELLKSLIDAAVKEFNAEVDDVQIKIKMTVK